MVQEVLFLLLPVAALSGWLLARRTGNSGATHVDDECPDLSKDYFKGLNYLLNEEPDKALEVFIQISELDSNTIELHFAMANLLSKRGEVERAIRIHQNLIARPMLSRHDRSRALYELARDYLRAGLLDRAEALFSELIDDTSFGMQSRRQLLDVYQQEKEWEKAIQVARRLKGDKRSHAAVLAHFFCEQADEALSRGDLSQAMKLVKRGFSEDRNSVRASLLEAQIHLRHHNYKAAIRSLKRVIQQNSEYLPLTLQPLCTAYEQLGDLASFTTYLRQLPGMGSVSSTLLASEQLQQREGDEKALQLLHSALQRRPSLRLLQRILSLQLKRRADDNELQLALRTLDAFLADKPLFHCENCGFASSSMHWQCPGCKQWDRVKPIHGIAGD